MIGSLMTGALITLLSSTIANGLPTFSRGRVAEALRASPSKRKLTTGSLLLERRLGVGQHVAADHDPPAHDIGVGPRLLLLARAGSISSPAADGRCAPRRA